MLCVKEENNFICKFDVVLDYFFHQIMQIGWLISRKKKNSNRVQHTYALLYVRYDHMHSLTLSSPKFLELLIEKLALGKKVYKVKKTFKPSNNSGLTR